MRNLEEESGRRQLVKMKNPEEVIVGDDSVCCVSERKKIGKFTF